MKGKILRCLAGACFALLAGLEAFSLLTAYGGFPFVIDFDFILNYIVFPAGLILIAIGLFANLPILSAVGCGVQIIRLGYDTVGSFLFFWTWSFSASNVLFLLSTILLMISALSRKNGKVFGLLSGILFGISRLILILFLSVSNPVFFLLSTVVYTTGAILMGYAMKERELSHISARHVPSGGALAVSDRIDQLTKLKNLLDQGILTQEEFEEKKEKILQ
ncbi:MAG: SHOCT domain-containing protein [Clostridia bacterium]|nr:SHOCT domain-containing protein [Clostridia bacterium]MBQ4297006.1 SHOCT domain-containing protein [Clostridia bacterium]